MSKRILFVDDSESIREAFSHILQEAGFNVTTAIDGSAASKLFDGREIDLLISDLHMPKINGIELTRLVRSNSTYRYLPILIFTTETSTSFKTEAKEAGASGWLVKQTDKQNILKIINKLIR